MNQALPANLAPLLDPAAYPHPVTSVELRHTHISLLFFAGERVYKVKKPLDLGFLDFTTLEQRLHACREEVRLNQRLAPGIYLGVVAIVPARGGGVMIRERWEPGEALEHAVQMIRLPADRMMDRLLEENRFEPSWLDELAALLAGFHAGAATGQGVDEHGTPEAIRRRLLQNLEQARRFAGTPESLSTISPRLHEHLRCSAERLHGVPEGLLRQRVREGRIREGHGDLHAGNICRLPERFVIYDRIEFSHALRCCDVACDLAFLVMDLDHRGDRALGEQLVRRYARRAGDDGIAALMDLYRCHLAAVRGKVHSIAAGEEPPGSEDAREQAGEARRYFHLAAGYALPPALLLMCGLPGTGKSHVAQALAAVLGATIVRTDVVRKQLAGLDPTARGGAELYAPAQTGRTYAAVLEQGRRDLEAGRTVIIDASFAERSHRRMFQAMAREIGRTSLVVHVTCDEATVRRRLERRAADSAEVSDAGAAVHELMRERFEPPEAGEPAVTIDGAAVEPEVEISRVIDALLAPAGGK